MHSSFILIGETKLQDKLLVRYGIRAIVFGKNIAKALVRKLGTCLIYLYYRFICRMAETAIYG